MDKYIQSSSTILGSLKNAVLGNPVTREYQIGRQIASFGPGLCWRVFEGKKKSTAQEASVFVLEKKVLDNSNKKEKELILEAMRRGPVQLTKLKHPRILTVQHPLEESRDSLAFATEPILASLANVLGKHDNLSTPLPTDIKEYELYDVERVYGLLQILEGLAFLHNDVKLVEGNLVPEGIVITRGGQWKLAGFHFSSPPQTAAPQVDWDPSYPYLAKADLNYLAPEHVLSQSRELNSDMYTFGCLMSAVYNNLKTPFDAGNSLTSYKRCIEQLSRYGSEWLRNVPHDVKDHVLLLLNIAPEVRPDANQSAKHPFFDNVAAMTLKYLDSLVQRDAMTKSQFFKNLHRVLSKLPKRVVHQRVLPHLFMEFPNHSMVPFVLPIVLIIADDCTDEEYTRIIFPELKKIFHIKEPVQVLLIFMQKMELLLKKTPPADVKNFVLPLVFRALESPSPQIQELVLSIIPNFAKMIDYSSMKNSIMPRIKTIICKTNSLPVRVNALVCIGKVVEYLDKFLMMDDIFPALTQVPSREPAVLMGMLGIYKQTLSNKKMNLEKDYIAKKAIPFLLPLAVDPGLNATQFNNFMAIIRDMLDRVEQEHRTKLEQLSQLKKEQESALQFVKAVDQSHSLNEMMSKVDKLVIGSPEKVSESFGGNTEFAKIFGGQGATQENTHQDLMSRSEEETKPKEQPTVFESQTTMPSYNNIPQKPALGSTQNMITTTDKPSYQPMTKQWDSGMSGTGGILQPNKPELGGGVGSVRTPMYQPPSSMTSSAVNSLMSKNVNMMGIPNLGGNQPLQPNPPSVPVPGSQMPPRQQQIPSNTMVSNSFNTILTPELKNFKSNQPTLSMNQLQRGRQQQPMSTGGIPGLQQQQQQQTLVSNPPLNGGIMSQTQSITMYQTQTQHMFPMMPSGTVNQSTPATQNTQSGLLAPLVPQSTMGTQNTTQRRGTGNLVDMSDLLA